jgi:hypothetical protein
MQHAIPTAALEQHIAILGKTGSGKTYAAKGVVESILSEGGRVCVIDPTGAWHGLRSSATGKSAGFPGRDLRRRACGSAAWRRARRGIAEIIGTAIDAGYPRHVADEGWRAHAVLCRLCRRAGAQEQGAAASRDRRGSPVRPQGKVNDPQSGAMLHAANNLVSLGRSRGLRIILITQRPAKLHKDSLTQVETLVALRLIAPQDRKAVEDWIKDNADEKQGREIISSLATLKTGQGWVWAPELGVLERVTLPEDQDVRHQPRAGGRPTTASGPVLAPIDKDAIQIAAGDRCR